MTDQTDDRAPHGAGAAAEIDLISAERLIFFSDAVAAIAITLLALGLPVPNPHATDLAVWKFLRVHIDDYLAFLISFAVIGTHWRNHHRLYRYVDRLDSRLISLNMLWLLMIIITPYATRLLPADDGFGVRFCLYAVVQMITILAFVLMRQHIRGHGLLRPGAAASVTAAYDISFLAVAGAFAISIPIAFATESEWTYLVWIAAGFAARAIRRARDPLNDSG